MKQILNLKQTINANLLDDLADFYQSPSYEKLAMMNSVLEPRENRSQNFFDWSRQNTEMLLTLKSQEQEKNSEQAALASLEKMIDQIFN